jgi:hypothetical protein
MQTPPAPAPPLPGPPPRWLALLAVFLRSGLRRFADLLVPAELRLFEAVCGVGITAALGIAARLRLADLLAKQPMDAAELAVRTGLPSANLHRLLRGLVSVGIFAYRHGRFENNRLSRTLQTQRAVSLRDWAHYFGSPPNLRAWSDLERTLATGESAFQRQHGLSVWEWFAHHPEDRDVFAGAMGSLTGLFANGVASAYPFAEVRRLGDVGGGVGTLLASILRHHPHLEGMLFDAEGVIASAVPYLAAQGVAARVETQVGDFFTSVPSGCDAYLLKNILHDWDDEHALRILRNCRRAMQPGNRLLAVESLVEAGTMRGFGPLSDLQMLVVCEGGRERSRSEFERLYEAAGFRLTRVVPAALLISVIEGVAI